MKKKLTTLVVLLISTLPFVYLAVIWQGLPQTVPVHYGLDMKPDRMGDKSELWLVTGILCVVSILLYFLLKNLHRIDPKRRAAPESASFHKLALGMVVFMAALNFIIINSAKGSNGLQNFLFPLLGLMFAFIGNYMNSIKPNYFAGIRLPWTLNNDENWRKTHQLGGKLWFAGGMLIAVVCLFLPAPASFIFFVGTILIMVIIPIVYSYRLFKRQG